MWRIIQFSKKKKFLKVDQILNLFLRSLRRVFVVVFVFF